MSQRLTQPIIKRLFELLNEELKHQSLEGELYLVGGAVMCLVYDARPATQDVDALFQPAQKLRKIAAKVGDHVGVKADWLNDAVKGYLSDRGEFDSFLELSHLRVFVSRPDYLLAMKCLALRIGEEFYDLDDIRYLLRYLNITTYQGALDIITRYYPLKRFPQKTLYALEELIGA
ncbi:DUF6036 family nucleotidyltransferase [Coxiella burnetii]|uniref:Nucleotidyl transferase n=1 Tax=Coxiella burnetii (strain RSA 493 / Nine Mile phase I) TaxID=227377 RepID=Q83AR0_COXBU|nr:DUF6036 family nucleotidyltransferase [Coxiella burnetii]NP_820799.1 hypothetical protein CBU_1820 [Coxiella burnetii RSA 493]AAO91313.1 hypothetical protein CBU_1820 [Coxiella burnetii RSA 493]ACJ17641.1 hypothetical protein CbuG_0193 [Coxiella burnetii CbuG_Q212]AML48284.1 hypothetical protein AUR58_03135 [Coxiella burnetii]AML54298.1 hypothetical protein AYM38_02760 [Coxiella burnetii]ARI66572.1 hypothetical protein B7L74_09360 [Coxiella burnetii]